MEPILDQQEQFSMPPPEVSKGWRIFLLVVAGLKTLSLYTTVGFILYKLYKLGLSMYGSAISLTLLFTLSLNIIFTSISTLMFILFFKRKRWGWILYFAMVVNAGVGQIIALFNFMKFQFMNERSMMFFMGSGLIFVILGLLLYALLRDDTKQHYAINKRTVWMTTFFAVIFSISSSFLWAFLMKIMYGQR